MENTIHEISLAKLVKIRLMNKSGEIFDEFEMKAGANLWVFLRKKGLPIGSACSGVGVCGACDIKVIHSTSSAVSSQNNFERETLLKNSKSLEHRLACLSRVFQDITIQADYW